MKNFLKKQFPLVLLLIAIVGCKTDNRNVTISSFTKNTLIKHTVISKDHPMAVWQKKMGNKTNKKRCAKTQNINGYENKSNGFVED